MNACTRLPQQAQVERVEELERPRQREGSEGQEAVSVFAGWCVVPSFLWHLFPQCSHMRGILVVQYVHSVLTTTFFFFSLDKGSCVFIVSRPWTRLCGPRCIAARVCGKGGRLGFI
jgi:hypothetical protein